jgi:hypothetical protein
MMAIRFMLVCSGCAVAPGSETKRAAATAWR